MQERKQYKISLPMTEKQKNKVQEEKEWPHKSCINYEDGCEEWAGCPCVYYKAEMGNEE